MEELIKRGHIYIAQPPLYKIKKGKQEIYVKDDPELNRYLLQLALENAKLHVSKTSPALADIAFEELANEHMHCESIIGSLSAKYDEEVVRAICNVKQISTKEVQDIKKLTNYIKTVDKELQIILSGKQDQENKDEALSIVLDSDQGDGKNPKITVRKIKHGVVSLRHIPRSFFGTNDYKSIISLNLKTKNLLTDGAFLLKGEKNKEVDTLADAITWLLTEARKGQYIQRYKGLGEMNPDQLWETTVNPETRRLLQVNVDDAFKANEIFETLMGDVVAPRREFIEKNALTTVNLDV
jgi:DNA gyrase subunit B